MTSTWQRTTDGRVFAALRSKVERTVASEHSSLQSFAEHARISILPGAMALECVQQGFNEVNDHVTGSGTALEIIARPWQFQRNRPASRPIMPKRSWALQSTERDRRSWPSASPMFQRARSGCPRRPATTAEPHETNSQ